MKTRGETMGNLHCIEEEEGQKVTLNNRVFLRSERISANDYLPMFKNAVTLMSGVTRCGKDWILERALEKEFLGDKVLFVGRKYEWTDYLEKQGFTKFNFLDQNIFGGNKIFISDCDDNFCPFDKKDRLMSNVNEAIKKGYVIIFNEIHGRNDNYHETIISCIELMFKTLDELEHTKHNKILVTAQHLTNNVFDEYLHYFDEIILMRTCSLEENQKFNLRRHEGVSMNKGDYFMFTGL